MRFPRVLLSLTVLAALATAGCGNEPASPRPASDSPSAAVSPSGATPGGSTTPSPAADAVVLDITLANGSVSPNGQKIAVTRGQTVTLNVTADHDDEVHVHGDYDIELEVTANTPVTRSFVADKTGSVEVESHHPEKIIAILNVR